MIVGLTWYKKEEIYVVPFKKEQYIIIYEPQGKYVHIHMKKIYGFSKKTEVVSKKTKKAQTKRQKEKGWLKIR